MVTLKANYLAECAGYEVYIVMTDAREKGPFFPLSPKVHLIQLDENFEELWNQPLWRRICLYLKHQRAYRRKLTQCLMELRPDITVSTLRREINFLCDIPDGSKKVGEIHVNRLSFRNLSTEGSLPAKVIQKYWNAQLLRSLRRLDAFVVLTQRDKEAWGELSNTHVIPNPLAFYVDHPEVRSTKTAVAFGRYCPEKGFDLLIQTWKKVHREHPDWKLHIYGDDSPEFVDYIKENGMEDICLPHPFTNRVMEHLCEHEFLILSSRTEGFGMIIAEAMACGRPVAAFDCPFGPREIIRNGEDGLLARAEDTDDLADKVCRLIENPSLRAQLGKQAHENIRRLHMEKIGSMWTNLFEELKRT